MHRSADSSVAEVAARVNADASCRLSSGVTVRIKPQQQPAPAPAPAPAKPGQPAESDPLSLPTVKQGENPWQARQRARTEQPHSAAAAEPAEELPAKFPTEFSTAETPWMVRAVDKLTRAPYSGGRRLVKVGSELFVLPAQRAVPMAEVAAQLAAVGAPESVLDVLQQKRAATQVDVVAPGITSAAEASSEPAKWPRASHFAEQAAAAAAAATAAATARQPSHHAVQGDKSSPRAGRGARSEHSRKPKPAAKQPGSQAAEPARTTGSDSHDRAPRHGAKHAQAESVRSAEKSGRGSGKRGGKSDKGGRRGHGSGAKPGASKDGQGGPAAHDGGAGKKDRGSKPARSEEPAGGAQAGSAGKSGKSGKRGGKGRNKGGERKASKPASAAGAPAS